jgi:tRNA (cytidine/uridine-2'-O-)-methyltransferase
VRHPSLESCLASLAGQRLFACSTRGARSYAEVEYHPGDAFLFGPETRGLPQDILGGLRAEQVIRIPMRSGNRSLNLSNAAAVVIYEAWRQQGFALH